MASSSRHQSFQKWPSEVWQFPSRPSEDLWGISESKNSRAWIIPRQKISQPKWTILMHPGFISITIEAMYCNDVIRCIAIHWERQGRISPSERCFRCSMVRLFHLSSPRLEFRRKYDAPNFYKTSSVWNIWTAWWVSSDVSEGVISWWNIECHGLGRLKDISRHRSAAGSDMPESRISVRSFKWIYSLPRRFWCTLPINHDGTPLQKDSLFTSRIFGIGWLNSKILVGPQVTVLLPAFIPSRKPAGASQFLMRRKRTVFEVGEVVKESLAWTFVHVSWGLALRAATT